MVKGLQTSQSGIANPFFTRVDISRRSCALYICGPSLAHSVEKKKAKSLVTSLYLTSSLGMQLATCLFR